MGKQITINYFEHLKRVKAIKEMDILEVFYSIKEGKYSKIVAYLRSLSIDKYKEERILKLPCFSISTTFKGSRSNENATEHNGIIGVDIDDIDNPEEVIDKLKKDEYILCMFISPSGRGVKVFYLTEATIETHSLFINQCKKRCDELTGIVSDSQVKDISRVCFVSDDPELYLNEDARVLKYTSISLDNESIDPSSGVSLDQIELFTNKITTFRKGNRNGFLTMFVHNCNKQGVNQYDVENYCTKFIQSDFDFNQIRSTIKSVYSNYSHEFGSKKNSPAILNTASLPEFKIGNKVIYEEVLKFIGDNYVLVPEKEIFFYKNPDGEIDYTRTINRSDLRLKIRDMGANSSVSEFSDWMKSEAIRKITAMHLFCDQVSKTDWDGVDYISMLVKGANLEGDFNQNLHLIKKWLVTAYVFGMRGIDAAVPVRSHSRVVLVLFSHERAMGKTEFFRSLGMSSKFEEVTGIDGFDVYSELSGNTNDDKRGYQLLLTQNLLLNIDDIDDVVINSRGEIRSDISKDTISIRPLYSNSTTNMKRRAAICGSTNHNEILRDNDENRYMIFSLRGRMDFEILNSIDYFQLWVQARDEFLKKGQDTLFNHDDLEAIRLMSSEYVYESPEDAAVKDCFVYDPNPSEELNFQKIKSILNFNSYHFHDTKIGAALKRMAPDGRVKKKSNDKRTYLLRAIKGDDVDFRF